jgi:hypothetical protein
MPALIRRCAAADGAMTGVGTVKLSRSWDRGQGGSRG